MEASGGPIDNTAPGPTFGQDVTVGSTTWSFGPGTTAACTSAGCL
jgi:hypothetical protein